MITTRNRVFVVSYQYESHFNRHCCKTRRYVLPRIQRLHCRSTLHIMDFQQVFEFSFRSSAFRNTDIRFNWIVEFVAVNVGALRDFRLSKGWRRRTRRQYWQKKTYNEGIIRYNFVRNVYVFAITTMSLHKCYWLFVRLPAIYDCSVRIPRIPVFIVGFFVKVHDVAATVAEKIKSFSMSLVSWCMPVRLESGRS